MTYEELTSDVREDGTIEGVAFETYYASCEYIQMDDRGFLRVTGDWPGAFVEIRVPYKTLEAAGWSRVARAADRATGGGE